ncbi:MAG TPA: site-2 protease family protein [Anaeromyxobacteraceae bacterium]|nr:site-2 protease family protein [Anaeromyxobacteraceae bacterium]
MDLSLQGILGRLLLYIPVLLLSLTVHEFAHAWTARRLGDDTAERMGRLTLNPLAHADPIGTFILPLLNVPFGWARPVPIDPSRFRRGVDRGKGMMIASLAGPFSNLLLGVLSAVLLGIVARFSSDLGGAADPRGAGHVAAAFLLSMIQMNVVLAVFNLLPVPPLDGSRIVDAFLPYRWRPAWETFSRWSMFLLLAIVFFGWRLIAVPVNAGIDALVRLASLLA